MVNLHILAISVRPGLKYDCFLWEIYQEKKNQLNRDQSFRIHKCHSEVRDTLMHCTLLIALKWALILTSFSPAFICQHLIHLETEQWLFGSYCGKIKLALAMFLVGIFSCAKWHWKFDYGQRWSQWLRAIV